LFHKKNIITSDVRFNEDPIRTNHGKSIVGTGEFGYGNISLSYDGEELTKTDWCFVTELLGPLLGLFAIRLDYKRYDPVVQN
jgi:hypothetical protein